MFKKLFTFVNVGTEFDARDMPKTADSFYFFIFAVFFGFLKKTGEFEKSIGMPEFCERLYFIQFVG